MNLGDAFRLKPGIKAISVRGDRSFVDRHVHILGRYDRICEEDPQIWGYPKCCAWGCSERAEDLEAVTPDDTVTLCRECFAEGLG